MKNLFKVTISILLTFAISISVVFLTIPTKTILILANTFVPSENNINNIAQSTTSHEVTNVIVQKSFNDFSESSIDKFGFYLRIDKINLFKAIIPDVDPRNKEEYVKSWENGISHGKFTAKPGIIGLTYLFAHAVSNKSQAIEKNAWFSYADELVLNDKIIIYYKGVKYYYEITNIMAVSPKATAFYTGASMVPMLRLQYCGPPTGSLGSRTLVDALLIRQEPI